MIHTIYRLLVRPFRIYLRLGGVFGDLFNFFRCDVLIEGCRRLERVTSHGFFEGNGCAQYETLWADRGLGRNQFTNAILARRNCAILFVCGVKRIQGRKHNVGFCNGSFC